MKNRFFSGKPVAPDETLSKTLRDVSGTKTTILTYRVELITPLFGGGTEPGEVDLSMPFRVKSIRGHLRFWWRLLAHEGVFSKPSWWNNKDDAVPEEHDRFKRWERQVWGGVRGSEIVASAVGLEVLSHRPVTKTDPYEFPDGMKRNGQTKFRENPLFSGLKYALFPAKGEAGLTKLLDTAPKALLNVNNNHKPSFILAITIDAKRAQTSISDTQISEQIEVTVAWWATFGGIGARTRRGLGAVAAWKQDSDHEALVTLDLPNGDVTREFKKTSVEVAVISGLQTAREAHKKALGKLHQFRQGEGTGRNRRPAGQNTSPGRSFWPEPDNIRKLSSMHHLTHAPRPHGYLKNAYPRAAFGLPMLFRFAPGQGGEYLGQEGVDPVAYIVQPFVNGSIKERWGSPLIVKPVKTKEGYAAISLCLPTRNQVTQVSVRPRVVSEADDGVSGDFAIFPDAARNAMGDRSDNVSLIPHNPLNQHCGTNAGDVLGAFLRFFVA